MDARFLSASGPCGLTLFVRSGRLQKPDGWRELCTSGEGWQLWQNGGRYVFAARQASPVGRQVTVDTAFRSGEVLVELDRSGAPSKAFYPLADLDVVLLVNWLANFGDLILHASGVEFEGRGYCFAGHSGVGKSTLALDCAHAGLAVLGEDNLVLRCLDGRFWIYGTPWHRNPALCSPRGVPLERLFFLDRTVSPGTVRCSATEGVERLMQTAFVPYYRPDAVTNILGRLALLAEHVSFYTLSYQLGSDVMKLFGDL